MGKPVDDMFDKLVRNAIDFMKRSLKLIEEDPKVSLILFWAGTELFVKARLLKEHWSLVLTDPRKADLAKFRDGVFCSVSFPQATDRLSKVCGLRVRGAESACFGALRNHRNKLVHFFNADYSAPSESAVQQVAIEQYRAWYYLHFWLTVEWQFEFDVYQDEIKEIHGLVKQNKKFLQAKYEELEPDIALLQSTGIRFADCVACSFASAEEGIEYEQNGLKVLKQQCRVCGHLGFLLRIRCADCDSAIDIEEQGTGSCPSCEKTVSMGDLIERFGKQGSPRDERIDPSGAYCSFCEYSDEKSVILLENGDYLCFNCMEIHQSVSFCEYCSEKITGSSDGTYFRGCVVCSGLDMSD